MKTTFYAVLHVTARQFTKLANLGSRVVTNLTDNVSVFATPNPSVAELTEEVDKLITLNGQAKGSAQKKDERDAQGLVVFKMLSDERDYVNGIAKGDKVKVDQSGFDSDKTPEAHGIPPTPAIKKVEDGKVSHSAKILLVSPLTKGARYSVQMYALVDNEGGGQGNPSGGAGGFDPDSLPWQMVLESVNSKELLITNLKRAVEIIIRVRAEDGSKKSEWGAPYLFLPR